MPIQITKDIHGCLHRTILMKQFFLARSQEKLLDAQENLIILLYILHMYIVSTYAWLLIYQPEKTNLCHHYI